MGVCTASRMCPIESQPAKARRRIILVDDEPAVLETWGAILMTSGYDVQCFSDPATALEAIGAGCDCVITDYHMPKMSGVELIRAARKAVKARFVLLTANTSEAVAEDAMAAGATCVMHKPTMVPIVLQQLKKLCG